MTHFQFSKEEAETRLKETPLHKRNRVKVKWCPSSESESSDGGENDGF